MKKILLVAGRRRCRFAKKKMDECSKSRLSGQRPPTTSTRPDAPPAGCARSPGALAQLVAHLLCKQGVRGSSPLGSTRARHA